MSFTNKFMFSCPIWKIFIFLAWFLWFGLPVLLTRSDESGHPCLVPGPGGTVLSPSPLSMALGGAWYTWPPFMYWGASLSSSWFVETFYNERMLNYVKTFPASIEIIVWFLSFILLVWHIEFIGMHMLNCSCIQEWILLGQCVWSF